MSPPETQWVGKIPLPNIVGPEYLANLLQKKLSTIKVDSRRKPETLPPRLQLPGSTKLLWVEEDVLTWLNSFRPVKEPEKKKGGRPSQVVQRYQQDQDGSSFVRT